MRERDQLGFSFESESETEILENSTTDEMVEDELKDQAYSYEEAPQEEDLVGVEPESPEQQHIELERNGQIPLINIGEWWEEHWKQMPEFVQEDQKPWKSIYVHFESREDMEAFEKLVGQRINLTTKFIWYPEATISRYVRNNRRYEDSGVA